MALLAPWKIKTALFIFDSQYFFELKKCPEPKQELISCSKVPLISFWINQRLHYLFQCLSIGLSAFARFHGKRYLNKTIFNTKNKAYKHLAIDFADTRQYNQQMHADPYLPYVPFSLFSIIIITLMNSKTNLAIILMAMLLIDCLHGLKWQGTGSGMNQTVISEIWNGLETNLNKALAKSGYNSFTKQISDRLNTRWEKAWNVILVKAYSQYDTILYGYAFKDQWMWYNAVPNTVLGSGQIITLIVWKDYNCQDWKTFSMGSSASSTFTTTQTDLIKAEITKLTSNSVRNDVWSAAHTMINNLQGSTEFSLGGYSIIMTQFYGKNGSPEAYGRICRVGDRFYNSYLELGEDDVANYLGEGAFYLFETRQQ